MSLKKTLVGAVAVVATLTVAGCGSAVDISGSQSASLTKTSFTTALTRATSQAKSVHMTGTVKTHGQTITLTADESFGDHTLTGMSGDLTVALPAMGSIEARIVDGVIYLHGTQSLLGGSGGKPWVKIDLTDSSNPVGSMLSQITDAMGPGQIADLLKGLSTVTTVGQETVDAVATTHYKVAVDTSKLGSRLGLDPGQLGGAKLPKTVTYDVWLDSASRPVKLSMAMTEFSVDLHFSKWGEPVHVVAPPASQVSSAPF
jgi:hypothetical protein